MITSIEQLNLNKKYSYADYLTWNFRERVELIKGVLFKMSPAPRCAHQKVSVELTILIKNQLKDNRGELYVAPFDVRFVKEGQSREEDLQS